MNFIFGIIILAMFILALRVIWATALQLLNALKHAAQSFHRYRAQRLARHRLPVIMPRSREDMDWLAISDSVRQEIQSRNRETNRELECLELQYQAKQKTIKLYEADIEIAKLERELLKIKPTIVSVETEPKPRRRSKKVVESDLVNDKTTKTAQQVFQLREALKGNANALPVNQQARH
jgi:biopolymer transport protein ExbB/TolQ